jgi:PAS domain S-box-containing protein
MRADTVGASEDRYRKFLALSAEGIARLELDPPLRADAGEDEQVDHILRCSRIAECNDAFARALGRTSEGLVGLMAAEIVPVDHPARRQRVRNFVRSGYQLVYADEEHALAGGSSRWMRGTMFGAVEDGLLRSYWLCLADVTESKKANAERERRGRILEAVAFSAARLLQPGSWRTHVDAVVSHLGQAAEVARAWLVAEDASTRLVFHSVWAVPGWEIARDDPRLQGHTLAGMGLGWLGEEARAGRSVAVLVRDLPDPAQSLPGQLESKGFAAVPIFVNGQYWGFLGFGETRFERAWSAPEMEALKAAAALLGAAIEREGTDEALRESEERFERLSAATFEGIAITEAGRVFDANEQMARLLAGELRDLVGRAVQDFVAPADVDLVRAHLASGAEEPYQHLARRFDGSVFPVEVRARSIPYRGRMLRVTAVRDVSQRVQAEERQRRLEADLKLAVEQWRETFDALDLGIVIADPGARIVRLNRRALELAAPHSADDLVGRPLAELAGREPWQAMLRLHHGVGERRTSLVMQAQEASSGRWYYLLASLWARDEANPDWRILTFRDATEFKAVQEQLRHARVMEALGSLVAGVAHEVRNPLFSISATLDALEGDLKDAPAFAEYATLLRSQVGRLTQLMRDLLDYGKPSVLRRGPTRLSDVVRRAIRSCAPLAREHEVRVQEDVARELPALDIDGPRVEQAMENLVANAIQHAPAGSVVRVEAGLEARNPAELARCSVEDEGPGLPPDALERVFEPFFTRRKGGTGLGLSIVQRVAEAHGGTVVAENRPGGGARFTLLLPVGAATPEPGSDA